MFDQMVKIMPKIAAPTWIADLPLAADTPPAFRAFITTRRVRQTADKVG
jgi:hypothetical protein